MTGRFTRQQRLVQAGDFKRVFEKPERCSDRYFTILYISSHDRRYGRLGLAVTKKRARRAVDRNRIKRIIRESFRQHQATLAGKDVVVLARDETARTDNSKLFRSLQQHWQKLAK